jgi:hypothetical protein
MSCVLAASTRESCFVSRMFADPDRWNSVTCLQFALFFCVPLRSNQFVWVNIGVKCCAIHKWTDRDRARSPGQVLQCPDSRAQTHSITWPIRPSTQHVERISHHQLALLSCGKSVWRLDSQQPFFYIYILIIDILKFKKSEKHGCSQVHTLRL